MKIEVDGRSIAFESAGDGTTLLLLHAFPLSSAMWTDTVAALSPRYRVVTVDAAGFGGSSRCEGPLTMERIAGDAAAVLDHLDVRTAIVGGCSMGGYAAFAFARKFAERLAGLLLVDTRPAPDSDEARAGRAALAHKVEAQGSAAIVEAMLPKILGTTSHNERPAVVARVRGWMENTRPAALVSALQGMAARADSRPTLGDIRVPTCILRGEEDAIIPEADVASTQHAIAGSHAVALPHAGHLPNLETPERFTAAVADFLAQCAP